MDSCSSSIIGVSSIYRTPSSVLPRRATAAPALSLPFASEKSHFNGLKASPANFRPKQLAGCGVTGGPSSIATAVASPNFSLLREEAFKGLEGFGDSDSEYESEADELKSSSGAASSVDELSISNLGLPKRLVDSLAIRGITELFPIQVSSCCLLAVGSLINVLGPRSLSELLSIMQNLLLKANIKSRSFKATATDNAALTTTESKESICMSILGALEAVIDKLSGFLNPYLGDILKLVVLHPKYNTGSNPKLVLKADAVRKFITEKIPVRILLPPLLAIYSEAIKSGDSSVSITFEMLGNLVQTMDRPSVAAHHAKIFDLCFLGLDLRSQRPSSIKSMDVVEKNVINTMISLTMKLTDSIFKPLFLRCIDWAESNVDGCGSVERTSINRAISFFSFVNKLTENHR